MDDRELLELAAKAVDLPECGWMGPSFEYVKENRFTEWNPLEDDGDALRLAIHLEIGITISSGVACADYATGEESIFEWMNDAGNNPFKAARRAIVRAAAEIGKSML